jgi:predicted nucleic acid-binding protein
MAIRALWDTNILLDLALESRPEHEAVEKFLDYALNGDMRVGVCAGSLKDFYYISRKWQPENARRERVRWFIKAFEVLPMDTDICVTASESDEPDYEDGLIRASAEAWRADVIFTRDDNAFHNSDVAAMTPREFLEQ